MGVSTNFAVEGTVRGAVNRSLSVIVPEDCCASAPLEMHRFSIERILSLLATVSTAAEVAAALRA
jgi:nicotinamidase-related amidase